jgi:hypothetical protein
MLKIKERNVKNSIGHEVDYILENGVELYSIDWNGEIYSQGYLRKDKFQLGENLNYSYRPVYKEIGEDEFELLGFEEIV